MNADKKRFNPSDYSDGEDKYIRFIEDVLGITLAETQKRIIRALTTKQRVLVVSANGVGKSYSVGALILAFLLTNLDSTVLGTSGSYSQFRDTMWRPLTKMFKRARRKAVLPGQIRRGNPPRLEVDDDWYAKAVSPRDPGDLEGRHDDHVLVVVEEADKRFITEEHFDSANSSVTDSNDRMIAVANPPKDESNVVYDKMRSDRWYVVQFSSFESHNVKADMGMVDERLPGLVDLVTVADDWESWNDEPWPGTPDDWPGMAEMSRRITSGEIPRDEVIKYLKPGFEKARFAHAERDDLDQRWYRRRAGVIPPSTAGAYRPFTTADVENAHVSEWPDNRGRLGGVGMDVARAGGDWNVLIAVYGYQLAVIDRWKGVDHNQNERLIRGYANGWSGKPEFAVDAQGEGSGLADRISTFYPELVRFSAGSKPRNKDKFYDKWAESLYHFGRWLDEGGVYKNNRLNEELLAASRVVEFDERYYASREGTVLKATKKDKIKDVLGRSPDVLDAALQAVWTKKAERPSTVQRLVW